MDVDFLGRVSLGFEDFLLVTQFTERGGGGNGEETCAMVYRNGGGCFLFEMIVYPSGGTRRIMLPGRKGDWGVVFSVAQGVLGDDYGKPTNNDDFMVHDVI